MDILNTAEFWDLVSVLIAFIAGCIVPAAYRPLLLGLGKIIEVIRSMKKAEKKPESELPHLREDPMQALRDAESRFKERQKE